MGNAESSDRSRRLKGDNISTIASAKAAPEDNENPAIDLEAIKSRESMVGGAILILD